MKEKNWHSLSINKIFVELKTSTAGLSSKEAKKRLQRFGFNELPKTPPLTKTKLFLSQFKNSLVIILLIAAIISLFLGDTLNAYVILAAIFLNVIIGFFQENKAQDALTKLKEVIVSQTKVIREEKEFLIEAKTVVPGDIIVLTAGDKVPADARLINVNNLEISEASLTGESMPIEKINESLAEGTVLVERKNMVYQGTVVLKGRAKAIVIATGLNTEIGKIAEKLKETIDEPTPLQKKLNKFSKQIAVFILIICLLIFLFGIILGQSGLLMFNTAVAIAVSAIPEGLLVSVTVILAIGMQKILKQRALVRRLISAETLGSTTVICTDKTGTLTTGEMQVSHIEAFNQQYSLDGKDIREKLMVGREILLVLKIGMLCNEAVIENQDDDLQEWRIIGSATDKALLLAAAQAGLNKNQLEKETPLIDELPFDSDRKYMVTLRKLDEKENIIYFKGAPEIILEKVLYVESGAKRHKITAKIKEAILKNLEELSNKGLRLIAFAYLPISFDIKKITEFFPGNEFLNLTWVGLVGIKDPLRIEAKETIKQAQQAGLKVVILTGDNRLTAKTIAQELDLNVYRDNILDGQDLLKISDEQLKQKVKNIKIYSRVTPHDKLRIIKAWAAYGEVVAMTGDGVNDVLALKQADIGIALGSGTEVAKETADLVLLDNNFSTIIAAIKQGRIIYDNIKKVVLYLISDSFSEVLIIFSSLILALPLPLLPAQILWINLVADSLPSLALTMEPGESEIMIEKPQERNKPIIDKIQKTLIGLVSIISSGGALILFYSYWQLTNDLDLARTIVFTTIAIDSLFYIFSCRSIRNSIFNKQFFSNIYLIAAVIISFIFQLLAIYWSPLQKILRTKPLNLEHWFFIIIISLMVVFTIELAKMIFIIKNKKQIINN